MAEYVWNKKDKGVEVTSTKWEVVKKCQRYGPGQKKCDACISEQGDHVDAREITAV